MLVWDFNIFWKLFLDVWKEEGGGVEVMSFVSWPGVQRREGFEDVAYTGLQSLAHPRLSICQLCQ